MQLVSILKVIVVCRPLANDDVLFVHCCGGLTCNVGGAVLLWHPFVWNVSDNSRLMGKSMLVKRRNDKCIGRQHNLFDSAIPDDIANCSV